MTARERVSTAETGASVAGASGRLGGGPEGSSGSTRVNLLLREAPQARRESLPEPPPSA